MSARTLRLMKEARPLLWPWIVVSLLGVTPLFVGRLWIGPIHVNELTALGALLGIPLLATLPFSTEFQCSTLSVLLTQPTDRSRIWAEKVVVAIPFVLSAAAMYYASWHDALRDPGKQLVLPLLFLLTMCSSAYWTLVGKSTLTGLMLNLIASGLLLVGILICQATQISIMPGTLAASIIVTAAVSAAGFMFWLGRRKFVRFESTGTLDQSDLLAGKLGGLFRASPTNALRNLVRKELRLLAPVWMLPLIAVVFMMVVTPLHMQIEKSSPLIATILALVCAAAAGIAFEVAPLLAGTLSIGEERQSGTQTWNLILPVSIRRQWIVKFVTGFLTFLAAQAVILLAVAVFGDRLFPAEVSRIFASPANRIENNLLVILVGLSVVIFVAAFWSVCALGETLRAALFAGVVAGMAGAAGLAGYWMVNRPAIFNVIGLLIATFHPYSFDISRVRFLETVMPLLLIIPLLGFMVFQGYRMFRMESAKPDWSFLRRRLTSLLGMAVVTGMLMISGRVFLYGGFFLEWGVMQEIHDAVVQLYLKAGTVDETHPVLVTDEDLARLIGLSARTRVWVRNSTISIFPLEPAAAAQLGVQGPKVSPYYVRILYKNGRDCRTAGRNWWCMPAKSNGQVAGNGPFISTLFVRSSVAEALLISGDKPVLKSAVSLKVQVDQEGRVKWARPLAGVVAGEDHRLQYVQNTADEADTAAAIKAVETWRYQPLHMLGWPASFVTNVTVGN